MGLNIRYVRPGMPRNALERQRLSSLLERMGLAFLLILPWNISCPSLVKDELFIGKKRRKANSVRDHHAAWTEEVIGRAYRTTIEGKGVMDGETSYRQHVESKFKPDSFNRRSGWLVEHCLEEDFTMLLKFLIPILNPESQTRISLGLATTISCSVEGTEHINWAGILLGVIKGQIKTHTSRLGKDLKQFSYCCAYVSHIYWSEGCFSTQEQALLLPFFPSTTNAFQGEEPVQRTSENNDVVEITLLSDAQILDNLCALLQCTRLSIEDSISRLLADAAPFATSEAQDDIREEEVPVEDFQPTAESSPAAETVSRPTEIPNKVAATVSSPVGILEKPNTIVSSPTEILQNPDAIVSCPKIHADMLQVETESRSGYFVKEGTTHLPMTQLLAQILKAVVVKEGLSSGYPIPTETLSCPTPSAEVDSAGLVNNEDTQAEIVSSPKMIPVVTEAPVTRSRKTREEKAASQLRLTKEPVVPQPVPSDSRRSSSNEEDNGGKISDSEQLPLPQSAPPSVPEKDKEKASTPPPSTPISEVCPSSALVPIGFAAPEPLSSFVPLINKMDDWLPSEWDYHFAKEVDKAIEARKYILNPLPTLVHKRKRRSSFLPTYADDLLPIEPPRSLSLDSDDIWRWVYYLRKAYAPFPFPHPNHRWMGHHYVWVGPDGLIISKDKQGDIAKYRNWLRKCLSFQLKSKSRTELGWVGTLDQLLARPPFVDAGYGVGNGS